MIIETIAPIKKAIVIPTESKVMTNPDNSRNDDLQEQVLKVLTEIRELREDVESFNSELERSNDRFSNYQKAMQWVVQLAFTLIASATITVIVTAILKR